jgi:hypothetical protein
MALNVTAQWIPSYFGPSPLLPHLRTVGQWCLMLYSELGLRNQKHPNHSSSGEPSKDADRLRSCIELCPGAAWAGGPLCAVVL